MVFPMAFPVVGGSASMGFTVSPRTLPHRGGGVPLCGCGGGGQDLFLKGLPVLKMGKSCGIYRDFMGFFIGLCRFHGIEWEKRMRFTRWYFDIALENRCF